VLWAGRHLSASIWKTYAARKKARELLQDSDERHTQKSAFSTQFRELLSSGVSWSCHALLNGQISTSSLLEK
jgi:hypothetical protein